MVIDYITHDEAIIQHFIEDPEFANLYLQTVLEDGNAEEIERVQFWYNEAKTRTQNTAYWNSIIEHAEQTAESGYNIDSVIGLINKALGILKYAQTANA